VAREEFDERLRSVLSESSAKDLVNALRGTAPAALIPYVIKQAAADPRRRAGDVDRASRLALLSAYKAFRLTPVRFRPIDEAIVTAGGVDLRALDPKTMEARAVPGLFFAGEVVDADAYTGGFNLQIAFSTGAAAGEAAGALAVE
jgi:predicted flavoprotein YhiN